MSSFAEPGAFASVTPWHTWTFAPGIVIPLVLSAAGYATGVTRLWRHAGAGRGVRRIEAIAFAAGWLSLTLALVSPLHELGEALFSAHMIQHELLIVVAAPLLVLGRPLLPWLWAMPLTWRRALSATVHRPVIARTWAIASIPAVAWLVHGLAIWIWHLPALFDTAVGNESLHALEHASFLGTALLFWWSLLAHRRARAGGHSVLYVVTTAAHTGALGVLLTFAPTPLYAAYQAGPHSGLTPLQDQQLAGLIMWVPGGIAYLVAAVLMMGSWLRGRGPEHVPWPASPESIVPRAG